MTKVNHVMSTIDKCIEQGKKNEILSLVGIKKTRKDAGFVQEIEDYLDHVSEAAAARPKTTAATQVAKGKSASIKEKKAQKQKEKDMAKSNRKK